MAYSNRMMVTTEVLVAQTVSMDSWVRYANKTAYNFEKISQVLSYIPYVGVVFRALQQVMNVIEEVTDTAKDLMDQVVPGVITFEQGMRAVYDAVMPALKLYTAVEAGKQAEAVVKENKTMFGNRTDHAGEMANGANIGVWAKNSIDWGTFTKRFTRNDRTLAREVVLKSRDAFTNDPCSDSPNCRGGQWWMNIDAGLAGTEKFGGTKLVGFERWEAQDTFDIWVMSPKGKQYTPIGWGRATAAENASRGQVWPDGKGRPSNNLAYKETKAFGGWKGIPELYDLNNLDSQNQAPSPGSSKREKFENPTLDFLVAVAKNKSKMLTTETYNMANAPLNSIAGSPQVNLDMPKDQLMAVSKAQVYFERPTRYSKGGSLDRTALGLLRDDNRKEYGSLYNPYWQVRLVAPTKLEKEAALALSGAPSFGSVFTQ
jgi:hypothetical protein